MYVVCKLQSTDKTKTQLTIINVVRFFHKKLPLPAIRWKSFQLKGPEILYTDSQSLVVRFFCKASWSSGCRDFKRRTTSWELAGNLDIPAQIQHIIHSLCKANTYDTIRIITQSPFQQTWKSTNSTNIRAEPIFYCILQNELNSNHCRSKLQCLFCGSEHENKSLKLLFYKYHQNSKGVQIPSLITSW